MYKVLQFNSLDDVFVTSDCHFNHDREFIWGKRGFKDSTEHTWKLVEEWNKRVQPHQTVFHLGDFVFKDPNSVFFENIANRLNGFIYFCGGNHISSFKNYISDEKPFPQYHENGRWAFLPNYLEIKVGKDFFVLCHYPIISHNNQNRGSYMLCGHSHGSCEFTNINTGKGRRLDVGIDSFGGPISLKEVTRLVGGRDVHSLDHHSTEKG